MSGQTAELYTKSGTAIVTLSKPNAEPGELDFVLNSNKFKSWWGRVNRIEGEDYKILSVDIRDVNMFGPTTVGFIKADCVAERLNGRPGKIPAIVFIRGDAVAILVKVTVTEQAKSYYVLTNQLRFPVGQYCLEIAAGMMDDRGDFGGVAAKELEEELGIKINEDDLRELGAFYPSPGGCDESIQLYSYETEISESEFNAKQRAIYGASEENERILLQFVPEKKFSSLLYDIGDAKAEVAYRRYLLDKRRDRAASCGYSPKTSRCGIKYAGKNPEYCTYNEDTSRCRIVDSKKKGKRY